MDLQLVERHGHAAAVGRHEDGNGAAVLPIEEAHTVSSDVSAAPATVREE